MLSIDSLLPLFQKRQVKLFELGEKSANLVGRWQDSRSEVVSVRSLMKSAAWHNANAGQLKQLQAIEHIRLHVVALKVEIKFIN
jgi:hypothetical protein